MPACVQALAEPEAQPTPRRAKPELQSAAAAWLVAAEAASVKPDAAEAVTEAVAACEAVAEGVVASGEATTELSAASIRRMKVAELRDALAARELPTDGLKPALAARLMQHCGIVTKRRKVAKAKSSKVKAPEEAEAPVSVKAQARSRRHTQWLAQYMRDN